MDSTQEDEKSRFKLAQLWHTVKTTCPKTRKTYLHNRVVKEILKDDFNINHIVTVHPGIHMGEKSHLKDCTALHFLSYKVLDIDTFKTLLERGADYTIKNRNGQTALHLMISECCSGDSKNEIECIKSVLSHHIKFQNSVNPHDDNNFSHLHGACIANHVEAAELFLNNGASIEESVNLDAFECQGFTPIHFAAEFFSFEVAQILVNRGANVNALTAEGYSPLDLIIENQHDYEFSPATLDKGRKIMELFIENNVISMYGLSNLHIACMFKDLTIAKRLFDQGADIYYAVPTKYFIYAGCTALHFAVGNSIEAVKMLVLRGAKLDVANALGLTPLDGCIAKYGLEDLCNILSCTESLENILLSDGETKLLDLIAAMKSLDDFRLFMQDKDITAIIPNDSVIWPGYTILHLAVTLSREIRSGTGICETMIVEECLSQGLSVNIQDVKKQSPIHIASIQTKDNIINMLLGHLNHLDDLANLVDEDNYSYLHIASESDDAALVEKLLAVSDPNIQYNKKTIGGLFVEKITPLHIAADNFHHQVADMLLRHGANLHATDSMGLAPIHYLIHLDSSENPDLETAAILFDSLLTDPECGLVDNLGLNYLHVACLCGHAEAVEKLIDLGSNVNEVIKYNRKVGNVIPFLGTYPNYTPLKMAIKFTNPNCDNIVKLLFLGGADVFQGDVLHNKIILRCFLEVLWDQEDLQNTMEEKLGLTKLHIACYLKDEEAVRSLLEEELDVNVPVNNDSVIFAGYTPLHLLMTIIGWKKFILDNSEFTIAGTITLLLDRGANVKVANADKDTPIHLLHRNEESFADSDECVDLLMDAHRNFNINPVNADGVSHFHLACLWHKVDLIQNLFRYASADINRPIDYFSGYHAGCTPLHLALVSKKCLDNDWMSLLEVVEVLLNYGANVAARDVYGDTPVHKCAVLSSLHYSILQMLLSHGGDVDIENLNGQTTIRILTEDLVADMEASDRMQILNKYNYKINSWNRLTGEGHISKIFLSYGERLSESSEFKEFTRSSDAKMIDDMGRTAIHNVVAYSGKLESEQEERRYYLHAIGCFTRVGIAIDHQDELGRTALHYATQIENPHGLRSLLSYGADVSILDNSGKSAFSYAVELSELKNDLKDSTEMSPTIALCLEIQKLLHLNIRVRQRDEDFVKKIQHFFAHQNDIFRDNKICNLSEEFYKQAEMTKAVITGTNSLTFFDLLSKKSVVNSFSLLPRSEREVINTFFASLDMEEFSELCNIIHLQFRRMHTRSGLMNTALYSMRKLLGFSVPGLCEEISTFLSNSELENVIESTKLRTRKRKWSEITE